MGGFGPNPAGRDGLIVTADEVAVAAADRLRAERVQVLPPGVGASGQAFEPSLDAAVKPQHAREGALLVCR